MIDQIQERLCDGYSYDTDCPDHAVSAVPSEDGTTLSFYCLRHTKRWALRAILMLELSVN